MNQRGQRNGIQTAGTPANQIGIGNLQDDAEGVSVVPHMYAMTSSD